MAAQRSADDFRIELDVQAPAWDESVLPCASRWFDGSLLAE